MKIIILAVFALLAVGCAAQAQVGVPPTHTPYPTNTPVPTTLPPEDPTPIVTIAEPPLLLVDGVDWRITKDPTVWYWHYQFEVTNTDTFRKRFDLHVQWLDSQGEEVMSTFHLDQIIDPKTDTTLSAREPIPPKASERIETIIVTVMREEAWP